MNLAEFGGMAAQFCLVRPSFRVFVEEVVLLVAAVFCRDLWWILVWLLWRVYMSVCSGELASRICGTYCPDFVCVDFPAVTYFLRCMEEPSPL